MSNAETKFCVKWSLFSYPITYIGSAQFDPILKVKCFHKIKYFNSVSPEWLFGKHDQKLKIQTMHHEGRLGLVAIDEALLVYDWQDSGNHINDVRSYMCCFLALH